MTSQHVLQLPVQLRSCSRTPAPASVLVWKAVCRHTHVMGDGHRENSAVLPPAPPAGKEWECRVRACRVQRGYAVSGCGTSGSMSYHTSVGILQLLRSARRRWMYNMLTQGGFTFKSFLWVWLSKSVKPLLICNIMGCAGGAQWAAHEGEGGCGSDALSPAHGVPSGQGQKEGRAPAPDGPWKLLQR